MSNRDNQIWTLLAAPFNSSQIKWRVGSTYDGTTKKEPHLGVMPLAYIDARCVMDRLDDVVGPDNWSTEFIETPKGRVLCKLSIKYNGEWITKTDGAGESKTEGEKGAISDALKRAAVQFGINRSMYDFDSSWVKVPLKNKDDELVTNKYGKASLTFKGQDYFKSNCKVPKDYEENIKQVKTVHQQIYSTAELHCAKKILWQILKDDEGKVDDEIVERIKTYSANELIEEILKYVK